MRSAVIVAAGSSTRYGSDKLQEKLLGSTVIEHSVNAFVPYAEQIIVVCSAENLNAIKLLLGDSFNYVLGGATRTQSVKNGLAAVTGDVVAIHDGARPFVSGELIERCYQTAQREGSCVPLISVTDSLWLRDDGDYISLPREQIFRAQTPQTFNTRQLKQAYESYEGQSNDDMAVYIASFDKVSTTQGQYNNTKITYADDLPNYSVGYGYDIHTLIGGKQLRLCGVNIDYCLGLQAHSDGDVALHALMDALLSACNLPDIGHYFPSDDDAYKDIDSVKLVKKTLEIIKTHGVKDIISVSVALVAEQPKLAPYRAAMKQQLAYILHVAADRISISATTAEGVGEIGKGEAIAARVAVIIQR